MDTENTPPRDVDGPLETAPPLPDDPRVPRPEDAESTQSGELGRAAPAVRPERPQRSPPVTCQSAVGDPRVAPAPGTPPTPRRQRGGPLPRPHLAATPVTRSDKLAVP